LIVNFSYIFIFNYFIYVFLIIIFFFFNLVIFINGNFNIIIIIYIFFSPIKLLSLIIEFLFSRLLVEALIKIFSLKSSTLIFLSFLSSSLLFPSKLKFCPSSKFKLFKSNCPFSSSFSSSSFIFSFLFDDSRFNFLREFILFGELFILIFKYSILFSDIPFWKSFSVFSNSFILLFELLFTLFFSSDFISILLFWISVLNLLFLFIFWINSILLFWNTLLNW